MRRASPCPRLAILGVLLLSSVLVWASSAAAGPTVPHLNWGSNVNPARCPTDDGYRYLEINVTHHVVNDQDSGLAGIWATDDYNKHIQLWAVGIAPEPQGEVFCAIVRYQGSFTTLAGASPGNTDTIAAGIEGTFQGGYRAAIVGTLKENPPYRTRGQLGTFDYTGGPFDWVDAYFSSVSSFTLAWWGWNYNGGQNGRWVNAITGNEGDITD